MSQITTRRYFYPFISEFPTYRGLPTTGARSLPIATVISHQILCLPIFPALEEKDQERVINVILGCLREAP